MKEKILKLFEIYGSSLNNAVQENIELINAFIAEREGPGCESVGFTYMDGTISLLYRDSWGYLASSIVGEL